MKNSAGIVGLVVAPMLALAACNTAGCYDNQNSIPLAGFYSYQTRKAISVDSISLGGVGAPGDSLLLDNASGVSQVYLPLRSTQSATSYFIRYEQEALNDPRLNDTITFHYTSIPYFESEECGAMFRYEITSYDYTRHLIDSVGLVDRLITNADMERIRIYFRTNEESDQQ